VNRSWRFLRRPRWIVGTLLMLVMLVTMINLGLWQIRRLHQRLRQNAAIQARIDAPAMPLAAALQRFDLGLPLTAADSAAYRRVRVSGHYDPADEVLLRGRTMDGNPGFDLLTPLVLADGRALLVDRGWVPYTDDIKPVTNAAPPTGAVELTGLLRLPQPEPSGLFKPISPQDPSGPLKKSFYANPHRLQAQMPFTLVDGYLQLATQTPAQAGQLPVLPSPPQLSNGPHLSYAIQWFSFTAIAGVGYAVVLMRRARDPADDEKTRRSRKGGGAAAPGPDAGGVPGGG